MNEFFQIFSPDWWMNENNNALQMTDAILFLLLLIPVAYLFIYAVASLRKYKNPYPPSKKQHHFLVLFVVLKNGQEVIESINHFLDTQQYPRDKYDIVVAATQLSEEDLATLLQMPISIIIPDKEVCTKIYAIQQVMQRYSNNEYDAITIFNSDNKVVPNALNLFNNAYYSGCDAIQAHRMTENLDTNIAVLNATSEEINNHLFRKAHTNLGFSSALIGSGMMFDFEMFHRIAPRLSGSDFTKAMEMELLKENVYTEYMEEVICYCKKTADAAGYSKERQRWLSSQYRSTLLAFVKFPIAFLQGKWDLCEKLFQWMMPSRFLLIAYIIVCAVIMTFLNWPLSIKWYGLLIALFVSFLIAMPDGEINRHFRKAFWSLPVLIFTSAFSHIARIFRKKKKQKI
ncbi:glycosyltransferase family 2 protein [Bacteroides sp. GD17]|jgi:cellulose synthase/poly-beta-1,6-N-acetylglucosamine synthase-like glycosyltransferase|uniref:glycosyltransferase family 2 protein n=1 Tax=Bacteroides sp. GD17 TaxID=3139826 RepID=UPI0025CCDB82|nr:glycosyltransferase family 2 protein [uncultured Bacteroides sp.]